MCELSKHLPVQSLHAFKNNIFESSFSFILDSESFTCPAHIAVLLSPNATRLIEKDTTIDSFNLNDIKSKGDFNQIINLCYGESIKINSQNARFIQEVGEALGNSFIASMGSDYLNSENNPDLILDQIAVNIEKNLSIKSEIDKAAAKFEELDKSSIINLGYDVCEAILLSEDLKVESETSVLKFVGSAIEIGGERFLNLLKNVKVENLQNEDMDLFIGICNKFGPTQIAWEAACRRLLCSQVRVNEKLNNNIEEEKVEIERITHVDYKGDIFELWNFEENFTRKESNGSWSRKSVCKFIIWGHSRYT